MLEFQTAAELRAHYAAVHRRIYDAPKLIERKRARAEIALLMAGPLEELVCGKVPVEEEQTSPQEPITAIFKCFEIIEATCRVWCISKAELLGAQRFQRMCVPRHIAMAMCCRLTTSSLPQIGRAFGGRDHTTVLHARDKYGALIAQLWLPITADVTEWVAAARKATLGGQE